jgi:hypothetical protein
VVINVPSLEEFDENAVEMPIEYALAFFFGGLAVTIGAMLLIRRKPVTSPESSAG